MESKEIERLSYIEGLKGIAACIIAFFRHYRHFLPDGGLPFYSLVPELYEYGHLAVELFFMLSGFGIVLGYEHRIVENGIDFSTYLKKRVSKIFPIMIAALIVLTALMGINIYKTGNAFYFNDTSTYSVYYFFLHLFGMQYIFSTRMSFNAPTWFISVILLCYVIYYVVVYMFKGIKNAMVYVYGTFFIFGGVMVSSGISIPISNIGRGIVCFFAGCIIAKIYEHKDILNTKLIGYLAFGICIIAFALGKIYGFEKAWGNVQMTVILVFFPMLIISVLFLSWLQKILSLGVLKFLGRLSMCIYFWHFPMQYLIEDIRVCLGLNINYSSKKMWLLYVVSVSGFAWIYQRFIQNRINFKIFLRQETRIRQK